MKKTRESLVMIGNGMAGIACLEKLIEKDPNRYDITVFGDEPHPNYNRIKLSAVLAGSADPATLILNTPDWYKDNGIALKAGIRATQVDPAKRMVHGEDGSQVAYDKLIFATGSRPFVPPIDGLNGPGVFTFRTLEDCQAMANGAGKGKHAVIIGGGLLGLEAAYGLHKRGMAVTVVHLTDRLMEQQLDAEAASYLKARLEKLGFAFCLNANTQHIVHDGDKLTGVELADETHLAADMVVVCTGIRPNHEVAKACGLSVGHGIQVNDHLMTSDANIFAVGECTEHQGQVYGLVAPLFEQGKVLAEHLTGGAAEYRGSQTSAKLKVAGVDLFSGGLIEVPHGDATLAEVIDRTPDHYRKLVYKTEAGKQTVQGIILFGNATGASKLFRMITDATPIEATPQATLALPVAGKGESEEAAELAALADSDNVCECNSVPKGEIIAAIKKQGLCSREEVMACTKASSSCGSCAPLVEELLRQVQGKKAKLAAPQAGKKVTAEEGFKTAKHPLDIWPNILELAQSGSTDLPKEWGFRLRWFGLFWEAPRSDTFMLRIKINGGQLTAAQLRGICDLTEAHGLPAIDITTRQGIQIRGISIANVPAVFEGLETLGLTSMGSGADNIRNLTACPQAGIAPDELADVSGLVGELKSLFVGNRDFSNLPRKFNISVAGCGTNCTHPEMHDIAVQAVRNDAGNVGYTLRVGGQPSTGHFVSRDLEVFLTEAEVPEVCAAITAVFRDHGNRGSRKKARMSYLVDGWGMDKFRGSVENALGRPLERVETDFVIRDQESDPIGLHPQRQDGLNFVGIPFPVGRVSLEQARTIARLAEDYGSGDLRTTNRQNLLIINVDDGYTNALLAELNSANISSGGSPLRAGMTACSGNTYCKLATVESKHRAVDIVEHLEQSGLASSPLNIALSACPNTCANHSTVDIGLQGCKTKQDGKTIEAFHVFYGGSTGQDTVFGERVFDKVPGDQINDYLAYGVKVYQRRRRGDESFTAFCHRHGGTTLEAMFQPQVSPQGPMMRWLAERVVRLSGDRWTTYV